MKQRAKFYFKQNCFAALFNFQCWLSAHHFREIHKSDLIKINGFDETYVTPGFGEDTDIEFRARKAGMMPFSTRYKTIQYHLFHERPNREELVKVSKELFAERKTREDYRCQFGLETLEA